MIKKITLDRFFNYSFLAFSLIIIFGTTLVFSTITRSVFEVNKLGIFKICTSLMGMLFAYDQLFGNCRWFHSFNKNKWINSTILILFGANVLSTIFSKHIIISIYGCYDRWEGLITYSFYLFFTYLIANVKGINRVKTLIWGSIIAIGLSSFYGIVQSFGIDIVNWSMNSSSRVFGSINNPVHYCAVMGMAIPVIIGQLFYTLEEHPSLSFKKRHFFFILIYYFLVVLLVPILNISKGSFLWILFFIILLGFPYIFFAYRKIKKNNTETYVYIIFNTLLLVIYATYLSYSRATWLGLTAGIGLMFTFTTLKKITMSKPAYFTVIIGSTLFSAISYLMFLFNLHTTSIAIFAALTLLLTISIGLIVVPIHFRQSLLYGFPSLLLVMAQFLNNSWLSIILLCGALALIIGLKINKKSSMAIKIILILSIFLNIQFITTSWIYGLNFSLLLIGLIVNESTSSKTSWISTNVNFKWKLIIIGLFCFILISPKVFLLTRTYQINKNSPHLLIKLADQKINSYKSVAIKGTARTSMWQSSIPWFKDHVLLGTGLDTVKYYYPNYRRPEYGKLEGGHNFTPDRLHNEYLNVLATKGLIGFLSYYVIFVGSIFIILLNYIHLSSSNNRYLISGLLCGSLVYLGQVLFNFGVVATLVFFFLFLALGVSLKTNTENTDQ